MPSGFFFLSFIYFFFHAESDSTIRHLKHSPSLLASFRLKSAPPLTTSPGAMTEAKVGRKQPSPLWDFFEYDGQIDKSNCLVVEGCYGSRMFCVYVVFVFSTGCVLFNRWSSWLCPPGDSLIAATCVVIVRQSPRKQ